MSQSMRYSFCWLYIRCGSSDNISFVKREQHGHTVWALKLIWFLVLAHQYFLNRLDCSSSFELCSLQDFCSELRIPKAVLSVLRKMSSALVLLRMIRLCAALKGISKTKQKYVVMCVWVQTLRTKLIVSPVGHGFCYSVQPPCSPSGWLQLWLDVKSTTSD